MLQAYILVAGKFSISSMTSLGYGRLRDVIVLKELRRYSCCVFETFHSTDETLLNVSGISTSEFLDNPSEGFSIATVVANVIQAYISILGKPIGSVLCLRQKPPRRVFQCDSLSAILRKL